MLKCIYPTEATKLGTIAATYRSGNQTIYGSCPRSCPLLPTTTGSTTEIDWTYLTTELLAVPRKGLAWSYTHFPYTLLPPVYSPTTLNVSTDTPQQAIETFQEEFPTVYTAPYTDLQWPRAINGVRFIRCPAETLPITCQTCGGGQPLCARKNRNYVIVFVAHGSGKKKVGQATSGGCYASQGHCLTQWNNTLKGSGRTTWNELTDPDRLTRWVKQLPPGTLLRHRISGDIGHE